MSVTMPLFFLASALVVPLLAAAWVARKEHGRAAGILATATSLACIVVAIALGATATPFLRINELADAPAIVFSIVMLAVFLAAPKRDTDGRTCALMLSCLSGTLLLYLAENLPLLFAGWVMSAVPFFRRSPGQAPRRFYARPAVMIALSIALAGCAVALMTLDTSGPSAWWAFGLAVAAALIRTGIFPFHSWALTAFEEEKLPAAISIAGAQAGAFLIVRLASATFAEPARAALPYLSGFALFSTLLMALMVLGESAPRRILALVILSQSGLIMSGIELSNVPGVAGALVQWLVVSVGATGVLLILRALEARCGTSLRQGFAGLGTKAPRLAVLFLVFSLTLVGLPGTLGFCAEELLFHGALEERPVLGVVLPTATSISAIRLLRLFSRVFLGKRDIHVPAIVDALPRERWVLTALALFLVVGGFAPTFVIQSRIVAAHSITRVLEETAHRP